MTTEDGRLGVGIALPQTVGPGSVDPWSIADYARRAEKLGFEGLWVSELLTARVLDPLALLAYGAAVTDRIRLGVAVVLTDLRVPLHIARETATIDQLSAGRLTLAVGLGSNRAVYPAYGLSAERRARRFEEGIEVLKRLWAGEEVTHHGFWRLNSTNPVPLPVQRPHPPLWFGARSAPALRRAVRHGDGWIGSGSEPPEVFAANARTLTQLLEEADRDPHGFATAKRVYVAVGDDEHRVRERSRAWFGANYGKPALADEVVVIGPPDRCAEALDGLQRSGAGLLVLNPMFDESEQMEALATEVAPLLAPRTRTERACAAGVSDWSSRSTTDHSPSHRRPGTTARGDKT